MRTILLAAMLLLPGCAMPQEAGLPEALLLGERALVVELDYATGREPCQPALKSLVVVLREITGKTVEIDMAEIPETGGVEAVHLASVTAFHREGTSNETHVRLHIVYLDGVLESGKGHAAGRTLHDQEAIFVFPDSFSHARGIHGDACDVERVVLLHELGHAVGLVNRGLPMTHDRMAEPGHSNNPKSVMYPTLRIAKDGLLLAPLPEGFDRHDLADIREFQS